MFPYFPNEYVENVFSIDYGVLRAAGYRALIFDIDNTLTPHGCDCPPEVEELFGSLHAMGFRTLLLSNNSEERILSFKRGIDTLHIADAGKPAPAAFLRALEMLGVSREEAIVIGDTTHTDIAGANRSGIASILVKYIGYYNNEKKGMRRRLERLMLAFFPLVARRRRLPRRHK